MESHANLANCTVNVITNLMEPVLLTHPSIWADFNSGISFMNDPILAAITHSNKLMKTQRTHVMSHSTLPLPPNTNTNFILIKEFVRLSIKREKKNVLFYIPLSVGQ